MILNVEVTVRYIGLVELIERNGPLPQHCESVKNPTLISIKSYPIWSDIVISLVVTYCSDMTNVIHLSFRFQ